MTIAVTPTREEIVAKRKEAGLNQTEAAALVCSTRQRWADWEAGTHKMHPGLWRLFLIEVERLELK